MPAIFYQVVQRKIIQPLVFYRLSLQSVAQMIYRRIRFVKIFVRILFVRKQSVFVPLQLDGFVLNQKLTVVQPDKKRFVRNIRRKQLLQKPYAVLSPFQSAASSAKSPALFGCLTFLKQPHRPTILALCAQKIVVLVRTCNAYRFRANIRSDKKFFHFAFSP